MSAPEPQVRVDGHWYECDGCGVRTMPWGAGDYPEKVGIAAAAHAETCTPLRLIRLQARWDARDAALRALVAEWRAEERHTGIVAGSYAAGRIDSAAELEQAIGGGRG